MIPYTTVNDGRITLRPFQFEDSGELYAAVSESLADLKLWMSWVHDGYSRQEAREFIAITRARWDEETLYGFAITDAGTGALLGGCSLSHINPVYYYCNLGYWVRSSHRGQGIAGRAARQAARFAFEKAGLIRVEVVVAVGNEASLRVAEKIGAQREGLQRNRITVGKNIYDALMFSFIPQDFNLPAGL